MARHVYKKSKPTVIFSKMSGSERIIKKREARIKQRKNERQELFVSDYIKHKYKDVYDEATHVYQILSKNYPQKYDIRKTDEHKAWKKHYPPTQHPAWCIRQDSTEQTANPEPHPNVEQSSPQPSNPQPSPIMEASSHQAQESPEPPTPPKTHEKHSGLTTQTIEVITEETLQTCEQHDPETPEQLLIDLNNDPVWKDILDPDGMDIGLDIDDRLQNYLDTCQFW